MNKKSIDAIVSAVKARQPRLAKSRRSPMAFAAEALENRQLLSTVTWTGAGGDHLWSDVANWSTGAEPGQNDDVIIPAGDPTPIEVAPLTSFTIHTLTSAEPLDIYRSFTITGAAAFNGGLTLGEPLFLDGPSSASNLTLGAPLAGTGQLTVTGSTSWVGGTIGIEQLTAAGGLTAPGGSLALAGGTLDLPVGQSSSITGTLTLSNGAVLSNGGTLALPAILVQTANNVATTEYFRNSGTINSSNTLVGQNPGNLIGIAGRSDLIFSNSGAVNVSGGMLTFLEQDDGNTTGSFTAASGTKLTFSSNFSFGPTSSISGQGTVVFDGLDTLGGSVALANTDITGNVTCPPSNNSLSFGNLVVQGTFMSSNPGNISADSLSFLSGTLSTLGTLTISGLTTISRGNISTGNLIANGGLTMNGAYAGFVSGIITNPVGQTATIESPGSVDFESGARFVNLGTLDLNDASLSFGSGTIINSGTINSDGQTMLPVLFNSGTVNINSGDMTIGESSSSTGQFVVASGASLDLNADSTFTSTSSIGGAGTVQFISGTSSIGGTFDITGTTSFAGGTVSFTGNVTSLGTLFDNTITGTVSFLGSLSGVGSDLLISGNVDFGPNNLSLNTLEDDSPHFQGMGTITVQDLFTWVTGDIAGLTIVANGGILFDSGNALALDSATLINSASQTATFGSLGPLELTMNGTALFENFGELDIQRGDIDGPKGTFQQQRVINYGSIEVTASNSPDSLVQFGVGINFENQGTFNLISGSVVVVSGDDGNTTGTYMIGANTSIIFAPFESLNFTASSLITGSGSVQFGYGTVTDAGTYSCTGPLSVITRGVLSLANVTMPVSTLSLQTGTLEGASPLTVSGLTTITIGTVAIPELIASGGTRFTGLSGATVNLNLNGTRFVNPAGATFTVDFSFNLAVSMNDAAVFENDGTLIASNMTVTNGPNSPSSFINNGEMDVKLTGNLGPTLVSLNGGLLFTNAGLVHVFAGQFGVDGTSDSTAGASYVIESSGTVTFGAGTHTLESSAEISGPGGLDVIGEVDLNGAQSINGPAVTISGGGSLVEETAGAVNQVSALSITNGTLDLGKSTLLINYASAALDPLIQIRNYLNNGYNNGAWTGTPTATTGVITSAAAAANANQTTGIGYADSAEGLVSLPANTIELKYTLYGDTGLTGTVGFTDFMRMTQHYTLNSGATWGEGDFNYDGSINSADFNLLKPNYGQTLPAPAVLPAITSPPTSGRPSRMPAIPSPAPALLGSEQSAAAALAATTVTDVVKHKTRTGNAAKRGH